MSALVDEPVIETASGLKLLTIADLDALPEDLPSGPVSYELHDGRLVIMGPPCDWHGAAQATIATYLMEFGEAKGFGKARAAVAVIMRRAPDTVFVPDAAFIAKRSLPIRKSPEDYLETVPDIVVEVRGRQDSLSALNLKGKRYLHAGAQVVWILDPQAKNVTVLAKDKEPVVVSENETLAAAEIIPDFAVRVADLFVE